MNRLQRLDCIAPRSRPINCLAVQRAALESIGGWVTDCSVEDITTGLELNSSGWSVRATDQKVSEGISPETLKEW